MILLQNINREFQVGDEVVHALRDIQLQIPAGEYLSLMGPSGSGKSTLLNILGLLDKPSTGVYELDGTNTSELSEERRAALRRDSIGFVFQSFHLIPRLTAAENVALPLMLAGVDPAQRKARVARVFNDLGLSERSNHKPDQLSGGQRQRVAIARATIMQPGILLADEPTGNLDRASGMEVINTLEALHQQGLTLIIVTHDPALGKRASRHVRMIDGAIHIDRKATQHAS